MHLLLKIQYLNALNMLELCNKKNKLMKHLKTFETFNESNLIIKSNEITSDEYSSLFKKSEPIDKYADKSINEIGKGRGYSVYKRGDVFSPYYELVKKDGGFGKPKSLLYGLLTNTNTGVFLFKMDEKTSTNSLNTDDTFYFKFKYIEDLDSILLNFDNNYILNNRPETFDD